MIDVKTPLRRAYYSLLNGAIMLNSNPVTIADDTTPMGDASNIYVIMQHQGGPSKNNFGAFITTEKMILEIVSKGSSRVDTEVIDNIAGQILNLVCPSPSANGLPPQNGLQIINVFLSDDRYLGYQVSKTNTLKRRILTFTHTVIQTNQS